MDSYADIGTLLKAQREALGVEIATAAQILHIRPRYIEALEQGVLDELPGLAYTKGYLQTYAGFLELDKGEILRRFEQVELALEKQGFFLPEVFSKEKKPSKTIIWGGLGVVAAAYGVWWFLLQPPHYDLQALEAPIPVPIKLQQNDPCLATNDVLYPPCHVAAVKEYRVAPLDKKVTSIMELAR